jgi:hypothetical protein
MAMFMDLGMVLLLVVVLVCGAFWKSGRPQPNLRHPSESWDPS